MKVKKLLCLALTLAMLLTIVPLSAFATTPATQGNVAVTAGSLSTVEDIASGKPFKVTVGTTVTYHDTLSAALGKAQGGTAFSKDGEISSVATVMLLQNITSAQMGFSASNGLADGIAMYSASTASLTIEGNGYTMSSLIPASGDTTTASNFLFNWKGGTLNIQNLTANCNGFLNMFVHATFAVNNALKVTLDNCDIATTKYTALNGNTYSAAVTGNHEIDVTDSLITMNGNSYSTHYGYAVPLSIQAQTGTFDVDINNSTLTNNSTQTSNANGGVILMGNSAANVSLDLSNHTSLIANSTAANEAVIGKLNSNTMTVTMDDTTTLTLTPAAAVTTAAFISGANSVVDNGADYVLGANVATGCGVTVSTCPPTRDGVYFYQFTDGANAVDANERYTNAAATANVTLNAVFTDTDQTVEKSLAELDAEKAQDGYVCRVGDDATTAMYYDSVASAIGATTASANVAGLNMTVVLIDNINTVTEWKGAVTGRTRIKGGGTKLTIDGNGKTIDLSNSTTAVTDLFEWTEGTLELKNVTVKANGGITTWANPGATMKFVLTDCTITTSGQPVIYVPTATDKGDYKVEIEITNSTLTSNGNAAIDVRASKSDSIENNAHKLTITDSTVNCTSATASHHTVNLYDDDETWTVTVDNSTITRGGTCTGTSDTSVMMCKTPANITLRNSSNLCNTVIGSARSSIFFAAYNENVTANVVLAADTTLTMAPDSANVTATFYNSYLGKVVWNDAGAIYKIGKVLAEKGIKMPATVPTQANKTFLGWKAGSVMAGVGTTYTATVAEDYAVLTPVFTSYNIEDVFYMVKGASVRTADPIGIRFHIKIKKAFLEELQAQGVEITVGTLIAPNKYVEQATDFTVKALLDGDFVEAIQGDLSGKTVDAEGNITCYATLIGMPETTQAVNMKFAARGFIKIGDSTIYTVFSETDHIRSMADVAKEAIKLDAYKDNAVIKQIVALSDAAAEG